MMVNFRLGRAAKPLLFPLALLLLVAMACGTSAPEAPEPSSGETPAAAPEEPAAKAEPTSPPPATIPLAAAWPTSLPPAVQVQAAPSTSGEELVNFDIQDPIIDPERSRASEGALVFANHTALSPK